MAHTTMFDFVDQLLAKVRALPECQEPVQVYDGIMGAGYGPTGVTIGGTVHPTEASQQSWAELGAQRRWEEYEVDCHIWSWIGGDDATATTEADAQATARNAAKTIFNAIADALVADIDFTVANAGFPLVSFCGVSRVALQQTPVVAEDDGSAGRGADIHFAIFVKAQIQRG